MQATLTENNTNTSKKSFIARNIDRYAFWLIHILALGFIFTGVTTADVIAFFAYYFIGMFFVVAGYHRYFSHRSYKTSRFVQFLLAFFAQATAQKGVLWWASHHRVHHKESDTENDVHSAKRKGFWYSHVGWIISSEYNETRYDLIKDFAKYPELVFLNKYKLLPAWIVGACMFAFGGASMLFFGFFLGMVVLWHGTFTINSLSHKFGSKRYTTGDESRNNPILAFITLGEGWHNNHHHYMHSTRQGFFWYEFDIAYYVLKFLSWFGIVWDLRGVPEHKKYAHLPEYKKASVVDAARTMVTKTRTAASHATSTATAAAAEMAGKAKAEIARITPQPEA